MEHIYLNGSEKVEYAAREMQGAAESMQHSVGNLEDTLFRQRQFMDDWLNRLEGVLSQAKGVQP